MGAQVQATDPPHRALRADARRNRAKVLDAARVLLAERGLDTPVDEIARAAGVGVGTVYRHFPAKDDLFEALIEERFIGLAEAARQALEDADSWEGFLGFMRHSAQVTVEDRGVSEAMDRMPAMCDRVAESKSELQALSAQLVDAARATGKLRADFVPADIPNLICGLGRATRAREGALDNWERYLDIMLAGLRAGDS
jgi:AcrR family transcriptional regulator